MDVFLLSLWLMFPDDSRGPSVVGRVWGEGCMFVFPANVQPLPGFSSCIKMYCLNKTQQIVNPLWVVFFLAASWVERSHESSFLFMKDGVSCAVQLAIQCSPCPGAPL